MEQIACKKCTSPDCHGCNMYRLERMLKSGKLDALMDEKRGIKMDADVRPVEWIPVTERLPEAGERVLCYCRANIYEVLKMRSNGDWVHDVHHIYMHNFVTNWQPLPEPPKEK